MSFTTAATTTTTEPHQDICNKKIEQATEGLAASCAKSLYSVPPETGAIIADYIVVMKSEVNLVNSYKRDIIGVLTQLSKYHNNTKTFKDMTQEDVLPI